MDALAHTGVDFLKVYNSIPREAYFAIAAEARAIGIVFAGHVPEAVSPLEASDAGQRSEEHLINILLACSTREDELRAARVAMMLDRSISGEQRLRELAFPDSAALDETYSEEKAALLFRTFVKNGTWHTPTLALLEGFAHMRDEDFVHDPRRKYLLKAWADSWNPSNTFFLKDLSPEAYDRLNQRVRTLLARYEKLVGDMHRAGVQFLAGTDANGWNPVYPGFGLHEELALAGRIRPHAHGSPAKRHAQPSPLFRPPGLDGDGRKRKARRPGATGCRSPHRHPQHPKNLGCSNARPLLFTR